VSNEKKHDELGAITSKGEKGEQRGSHIHSQKHMPVSVKSDALMLVKFRVKPSVLGPEIKHL